MLVALHLSACMFYYMAYLKGLGPNTWVFAYGLDPAAPLWTKYLNSVYWATTTITTVGCKQQLRCIAQHHHCNPAAMLHGTTWLLISTGRLWRHHAEDSCGEDGGDAAHDLGCQPARLHYV